MTKEQATAFLKPAMKRFEKWPDSTGLIVVLAPDDGECEFTVGQLRRAIAPTLPPAGDDTP